MAPNWRRRGMDVHHAITSREAALSRAAAKHTTVVSLFRINVRPSVQHKCHLVRLRAMVSDDDAVGPAQCRRVGGPSEPRYFLIVDLWIPTPARSL